MPKTIFEYKTRNTSLPLSKNEHLKKWVEKMAELTEPAEIHWWGRAIFYDGDIDALHARLVAAGHSPAAPPRDASWGERFFHVADPDGHEISFAWPLKR